MSPQDTTPAAPGIAPGNIQFIDNFLPLLDAGTYTVTATQQMVTGVTGSPSFSSTVPLSVGGAGLVLDAVTIASVYPPANSAATYGNILPHIVLNVRTLPWEDTLAGLAATVPWLALLLIADGDGVTSQTVAASQIGNAPAGTLPPAPPVAEVSSTTAPVTVIDLPTALFSAITPTTADLPYLAHCRQLSLAQKSTSTNAGDASGWYSVVVSNRFATAVNQQTTGYTAHLVSVAGLEAYLAPGAGAPTTNYVRLVSLYHWTFKTVAQGLDFRQLMTDLVTPPAGTAPGDASYLRLRLPPVPAESPSDALHTAIAQVLQAGYIAAPYVTREGDHITGWYRGPFGPSPTPALDLPQLGMSSQAMVYDEVSGMFDLSYAIAWETGRMVALSDRGFAAALNGWRVQGQQLLGQLHHNLKRGPALANALRSASDDERSVLFRPNVFQALLANATGGHDTSPLVTLLLQAYGNGDGLPAGVSMRAPTLTAEPGLPPAALSAAMSELSAELWVATTLAALTQDSTDLVSTWLARLALFYGVPFNTLVPDQRMLPAESIRFFYVDANWIQALTDGALSVGIRSTRDAQFNTMMRPTLMNAVQAQVAGVRAKLLNTTPSAPVSHAVCGFLLRSAAVSGWPGLEISAYQPGGTDMTTPLRIDHLAPDVLLCLLPAFPSRIDISEPHEALRFGVEDGGTIDLRSISAANPGAQLGKSATVRYRAGTSGPSIIDVRATLDAISTSSQGALADLSSAGFAVQMVAAPERLVFWGTGS